MTIVRWVVALAGVVSALAVLGSAMRTVTLPRPMPAFIGRVAFLAIRGVLRPVALRSPSRRREYLLSLQGPLGLFAQLAAWVILITVSFAAVLWAADGYPVSLAGVRDALLESGSSLTTLGFVRPHRIAGEVVAFVDATVGVALLALVITYLPTIYGAFSRREALVSELSVRAGSPPTATGLLSHTWRLGRFEQLEELWNSWEQWFIDVGETHTSFPQLSFFRSARVNMSWVTAAGAVLDAAALLDAGVGPAANSRAELCLDAGIDALYRIARFFGSPRDTSGRPELPRATVAGALTELADAGVPLRRDGEDAWQSFARWRARYESDLLTLAALADAVPTAWLDPGVFLHFRPPLWAMHRAARDELG